MRLTDIPCINLINISMRTAPKQCHPFRYTNLYTQPTHLHLLGVQGRDGAFLAAWHDVVGRGAIHRLRATCLLICTTRDRAWYILLWNLLIVTFCQQLLNPFVLSYVYIRCDSCTYIYVHGFRDRNMGLYRRLKDTLRYHPTRCSRDFGLLLAAIL